MNVPERTLAVRARLIRTLDPDCPEAECLAVRAGRVEAVGSVEDVQGRVGRGAEWLDLRPAVVVPGLTDSHIHLVEWALDLGKPDLSGARSAAQALARVEREAAAAPPDVWIEFRGWDPEWRTAAELADLDRAAGSRPVALVARDLHSAWLNSEAMRRLGIGRDRADPPGGVVERDASGRPTGVLKERALEWFYQGRPRPSDAERRAALDRAQAALHRLGVTAVHSVEGPDAFRVLEAMAAAGELRLRVLHHFPQRFLDDLIAAGIVSGFGNAWLRIGGIKYFTDGALGSRTAWMLSPYSDGGDRGVRRLDPAELERDVGRAARAGLAAAVHAIGDAAVRMTLGVLERVGSEGLAVPHRIEHLQCVHPDDLPRAARAGIVASMQPSHLLTDIPLAERRWGPERSRWTMALRSLLDAGTALAFGSDAPVEAPDPREGFYAAVARRDRSGYPEGGWYPEERLSPQDVLTAYTVGPARAAGEERWTGRLAPGCRADFVAWTEDPATADAEQLRSMQVVATAVDGEVVYRA
jgi:predicted amidohydrolase YtcJ